MKKNRIWEKGIILLLTAVFLLGLTACGSTGTGDIQKPTNVSSTDPGGKEAASGTPAGTNASVVKATPTAEPTAKPTAEPTAAAETAKPVKAEVSETVLVDEAGVKITAKSLGEGSFFGPELKLLIENNSGTDLTFQCRNSSVNGYMIETMMSVDVADGKKANDSITFMDSALEAAGIKEIADMEFSFHIFTSSDWDTYLDTDLIQVKTSIADTYSYTFDDSGDLACETNGIKVVVKGLAEDSSLFGPSIVIYIENNGSQNVTVQVRDVSINGFMVDAMFSCDLNVGKRAIDEITFLRSDLEENEIETIEDVELSFHIFSFESWETIADTEPVKITFW